MDIFIQVITNLASTDYERAARLKGVRPQSVFRWRNGITKPDADTLLENPILADAIAADAHARAQMFEVEPATQAA